MVRCEVLDANSLDEACSMLSEHKDEARIIAGGQNLLVLLKHRQITPKFLININNGCLGLDYISQDTGFIKIGALTRHTEVEESALIKEKIPMLAELEKEVGCIQSRNWGTIGGNICQASPTSDIAPALTALQARCKVKSVQGERVIPIAEFFTGYQSTALKDDEILIEIQIPESPQNTGGIHRKEVVRFADPAIASVSVIVTLDIRGVINDARIIMQAVCVTPLRAKEAEESIIGQHVENVSLDTAAAHAAQSCLPISDVYGSEEYKREMIRVLTRRNLQEAIKRAQSAT